MEFHPCPRECGVPVYDLHKHIDWHNKIERQLASAVEGNATVDLSQVELNTERINKLERRLSSR